MEKNKPTRAAALALCLLLALSACGGAASAPASAPASEPPAVSESAPVSSLPESTPESALPEPEAPAPITRGTVYYGDNTSAELPPDIAAALAADPCYGVYASPELTLLAVSADAKGAGPVTLHISEDTCGSWRTAVLPEAQGGSVSAKYVSFANAKYGWVLLQGSGGLGSAALCGYCTADGGLTWTPAPSLPTCNNYVTAACCPAENTLLIAYRYKAEDYPIVYRSADGGVTWARADFGALGAPAEGYIEPQSLYMRGGALVCDLVKHHEYQILRYTSPDGGESWARQTAKALSGSSPLCDFLGRSVYDAMQALGEDYKYPVHSTGAGEGMAGGDLSPFFTAAPVYDFEPYCAHADYIDRIYASSEDGFEVCAGLPVGSTAEALRAYFGAPDAELIEDGFSPDICGVSFTDSVGIGYNFSFHKGEQTAYYVTLYMSQADILPTAPAKVSLY